MRKRCLLTLFVAIIWLTLAKGETRIEVDENGDEYELKRFHIQGRQLNGSGSKSQCVVTRRKRASRSMALPASSNNAMGITVNSQQLNLAGPEHREAFVLDAESGKRRYVALTAVQLDGQLLEDDDDDEEDDDDDEAEEEVVPLKLESQQKQLQGQTNLVAATFGLPASLPQGVSVVANAATSANVGGDAGIVVVESEQPPKVNPSTHAVFELKPLKPQQQSAQMDFHYWPQSYEEEEEEDLEPEDNEFFYYGAPQLGYYDEEEHFISSDSPVSTSAIWSTDNDDIHPVINEANQPLDGDKKQKKKRRKPAQEAEPVKRKTQKKRRKQQQQVEPVQQKKKQQKKPSSGSGSGSSSAASSVVNSAANSDDTSNSGASVAATNSGSGSGSGSNKRKRPNQRQQQKKKQKPNRQVSSGNRRRRPTGSNSGSSSSSTSVGGYRRRRPSQNLTASQRRRQQQLREQRRRQQEQQRRRRRRNRNRNGGNRNGANGGHRRRQYYESEPIINCIYINKDPVTTTTTARPFWNLLGRDAAAAIKKGESPEGDPSIAVEASQLQRNGDFGHRKRTNLRFAA